MGGRGSGLKAAPQKKMTREDRLNQSGKFQYHVTTASALVGIYNEGLKPNRGELGKGVYFSETEQAAKDWAFETTGGSNVLRVKTTYLKDKTDYDIYDDTQGMTSKRIPTKEIEIQKRDGGWEPLSDYAKRYWRSFGIRRP